MIDHLVSKFFFLKKKSYTYIYIYRVILNNKMYVIVTTVVF